VALGRFHSTQDGWHLLRDPYTSWDNPCVWKPATWCPLDIYTVNLGFSWLHLLLPIPSALGDAHSLCVLQICAHMLSLSHFLPAKAARHRPCSVPASRDMAARGCYPSQPRTGPFLPQTVSCLTQGCENQGSPASLVTGKDAPGSLFSQTLLKAPGEADPWRL
jgi:hypothetical protein